MLPVIGATAPSGTESCSVSLINFGRTKLTLWWPFYEEMD